MDPTLDYQNLIQPVVERAEERPDSPALVFWAEDNSQTPISIGELHNGATRWATALKFAGVGPDDIVLLVLGHSQELMFSFWGAMYLGALPSIYPTPSSRMNMELYAGQVRSLVLQSGIKAIITHSQFKESLQGLLAGIGCTVLSLDELPAQDGRPDSFRPDWRQFGPDKIAFLQFSSGTTGAKKGVLISHQAVLNQVYAISKMLCLSQQDVVASWLPLHHDMGLIGCFLLAAVRGQLAVLMSPVHWVRDPKILLWAITKYKGALTYMPNFAFNHLVRAVRPSEIEGIDLSSWHQVLNGAEPIRHESIQAFIERYRPYGFRENAVTVGYGMAENTLAIALKPCDLPIEVDWVSLRALQEEQRAEVRSPDEPGATALVASGKPIPGTAVRILDEEGRQLPERRVGEIWLRGNCLFAGYYRQPELTAEFFRDGWFCTGDLGYMVSDWLYVTGREKDIIIVGGKNIYPADVEEIAASVPGIHPGRLVAFGIWNERLGTEGVVIVCEVSPATGEDEKTAVAEEVRRRVVQQLDIALADIRLVENRWIIKSSSGKLARHANRDRYLKEFGQ